MSDYTYHEADNPEHPGCHGDGCSCENCLHPHQMYCESCGGPERHEGGGAFREHALRDCIDWLARKDQFTERPVMAGCRPAVERSDAT